MTHSIRICLTALVLAAFWISSAHAALDSGTEPALYLGGGARAVALGRTGATTSGSVFALDWNPAGLAQVPRIQAGLQHAQLFGGAAHNMLELAYPVLDWGTVAAGFTRLELGGIERRDEENQPAGQFGYTEQQAALGLARQIWGPLSLGVVGKVHTLRLDGVEGSGLGLDAGAMLVLPHPLGAPSAGVPQILQAVRAGASVCNVVGPQLKLRNATDRFPAVYRLGGAVDLDLLADIPDTLSLLVDVEKPELAGPRWHAGLEYSFYRYFAVRGGWDHEYFSLGAGLQYAGVSLDYALSFPVLGLRHLVTLTVAFGEDLDQIRAKRQEEAEQQKQRIVQKLKDTITSQYVREAKTAAGRGLYREAARLWQKVLDWEPENREAKEKLQAAQEELRRRQIATSLENARKYFDGQQYVNAMLECRQVLELDPANGQAIQLYAQAENRASSLGEAATSKEVTAVARMRKLYLQGMKAYTRKDWKAAVASWEQVAAETPLQQQVSDYLEQARRQLAQAGEAGAVAEPAAKPVPEEVERKLYKEAVDLSRNGKLKDAVHTWEKLLEKNPADEDAKENLEKTRQDLIDSQKRGIRW